MPLNTKTSIIGWWIQGLVLLIPDRLKSIMNPSRRRILLQYQGEQLAIIWPGQTESQHSDKFQLHSVDDQKRLRKQLSKFSKENHDLVLCIPASNGLRKTIQLPLAAEAELDSILKFEIDRQTPFTPEQVYSGHRIISKSRATNSLKLELNVIPKKQLEPQLNRLEQAGIVPQRIELLNESPEPSINVLPQQSRLDEQAGPKRINVLLCWMLIILIVIIAAIPFFKINQAIEQVKSRIELERKDALEVNALRTKWQDELEKQQFVGQRIGSRTSVTVILNEITHLLPDDTWLSRLLIRDNSISLQGESAKATALIGLLDQSEHFSGTRFQSPVTTNISTGKDRFQITSQLTKQEQEIAP